MAVRPTATSRIGAHRRHDDSRGDSARHSGLQKRRKDECGTLGRAGRIECLPLGRQPRCGRMLAPIIPEQSGHRCKLYRRTNVTPILPIARSLLRFTQMINEIEFARRGVNQSPEFRSSMGKPPRKQARGCVANSDHQWANRLVSTLCANTSQCRHQKLTKPRTEYCQYMAGTAEKPPMPRVSNLPNLWRVRRQSGRQPPEGDRRRAT